MGYAYFARHGLCTPSGLQRSISCLGGFQMDTRSIRIVHQCLPALCRGVRALCGSVLQRAKRRGVGRVHPHEPGLRRVLPHGGRFHDPRFAFRRRIVPRVRRNLRSLRRALRTSPLRALPEVREDVPRMRRRVPADGRRSRRGDRLSRASPGKRARSMPMRPGEQPDAVAVGVGGVGFAQPFRVALRMGHPVPAASSRAHIGRNVAHLERQADPPARAVRRRCGTTSAIRVSPASSRA